MNPKETKEILALYDQEERYDVHYPLMQRDVSPHIVRHIDQKGREGMVIYSKLNEENADAVIQEQIAYFQKLGQNFEWKYYEHDTPSDLKERLVRHGFTIGEVEALMVLDLSKTPKKLLQPVTHDVRLLTNSEQFREIVFIQDQVWKEDHAWLADSLAKELEQAPKHLSIYVAYTDKTPVSAAWLRFPAKGQFASLWGGATLPQFRNQGFYTALLAARVQEAIQRKMRFLTIDASPMSKPIVAKFGFQLLTHTYPCDWKIKKTK
jgi:predicted GNAT family acetyltransferase